MFIRNLSFLCDDVPAVFFFFFLHRAGGVGTWSWKFMYRAFWKMLSGWEKCRYSQMYSTYMCTPTCSGYFHSYNAHSTILFLIISMSDCFQAEEMERNI